jgi:uncharacterized protein (TIGR02145 family)
MMRTKVIFLAAILGFTAFSPALYAQTSLGDSADPHPAAVLDLSNKPNKGIGLPKVVLNSPTDVESIVNRNPVRGLIVYNPGTAGLTAGAYFWSGASWVPVGMAVTPPPPSVLLGNVRWLTYNLGADSTLTPVQQIKAWKDQDATNSTTDYTVMGDLYQWSRAKDGHQLRSNATTKSGPVAVSGPNGQPSTATANFITSSSNNYDWRSSYTNGGTQDDPADAWRWVSADGVKNKAIDPCPDGFRVPTSDDWLKFMGGVNWAQSNKSFALNGQNYTWLKIADGKKSVSWSEGSTTGGLVLVKGTTTNYDVSNPTHAANTLFFLPAAGYRNIAGTLATVGLCGYYWSANPEVQGGYSTYMGADVSNVHPQGAIGRRAYGFSVRCIAE